MPKRICAVALTKGQTTILAGDKFGDAYALPLHPSSDRLPETPSNPQLDTPTAFRPSASELTVHTKGNREALRQQQLQRQSGPRREAPLFEHHLILGHVSVLTDLVTGRDRLNGDREYILTADRDEHIRVSRGVPQAHIIINYCLGHTEFVSKLCVIPEHPQFLISGGGEPSLRVFDWLHGKSVAQANLEESLEQVNSNSALEGLSGSGEKRSVSCIQALSIPGSQDGDDLVMIMLALEG